MGLALSLSGFICAGGGLAYWRQHLAGELGLHGGRAMDIRDEVEREVSGAPS